MTVATKTETRSGALEAIYQRRAVRDYLPTPVPQETIQALLDAAVQAPTAMHLEPWSFVIIQDPARLKRYSDRAKALLAKGTPSHEGLLKVAGVSESDAHLARLLADPGFNIFYNARTLIVVCGKPMGSFVTADCWLAAENLMLAATSLKLASCCIGFAIPMLNTPGVKSELNIPAEVSAVAAIIVGFPTGTTPPVPRRAPEILKWLKET